ncbi:MAG: S8 family serine peptidase [Planctomycetes bacterium]|nr:S8 family serine peptidase [Planctomycetota bacterium]
MTRSIRSTAPLALAVALSLSLPSQSPGQSAPAAELALRFARFDPLRGEPEVPAALRGRASQRLWIVQRGAASSEAVRAAVRAVGGEVLGHLPENAFVVRADVGALDGLRGPAVRWVGRYHPAYRLEGELRQAVLNGANGTFRLNLVVADKHRDKPALAAAVQQLGGEVLDQHVGSLLLEVQVPGAALAALAGLDQVLWVDRATDIDVDMDNARIQGGGNYVETQAGYSGQGVNAHVYEGIEATHYDFTGGVTNVMSGGGVQDHGHATAGIVWGNGSSNAAVRGMAPDCSKFFTDMNSATGSRWQVFQELVDVRQVSHTTASWGNTRTLYYSSISADSDDAVFDADLCWTQSQSNAGDQPSRPQAWAKNPFSVGGVRHYDNSSAGDDAWAMGGSTGPAYDGRIKPEICAYYDAIGTSDRTGADGYSANDWYASFGGTSGATPIVAGHDVLAIQMFTDDAATPGVGPFGNALRVPGGTRHQNRPHFPTLKALMVASATQYAFSPSSWNNRREHQGFGFPSLRTMWDRRAETTIVDEAEVVVEGEARRWDVVVAPGQASLKVVLDYADPAANPAAAKALVNDLSLRVTAPDGTQYWGNHGLWQGNWSVAGGVENHVDPLECVFVASPLAGTWHVDVKATEIAVDGHAETPAVDADFGLVIVGGAAMPAAAPGQFGDVAVFGSGCVGSASTGPYCFAQNAAGGSLVGTTSSNQYAYLVQNQGPALVTSFEVYTRSTGGTVNVPAYLYAHLDEGPDPTPLAATTLTIGASAGFYTATFPAPVAVNDRFYISFVNAGAAVVSNLSSGELGKAYYKAATGTTFAGSTLVYATGYRVHCVGGAQALAPTIGNDGYPTLGRSYGVTLADALPSTFAVLATGFAAVAPVALPGAPGCQLLISPDLQLVAVVSPAGDASFAIPVPAQAGLVGVSLFHQWAVLDPGNALGLVLSNGAQAKIGE